ncbi:MAG: ATP-binding cassette domain-containing protein [Mesorhizobium sp.]|nr:MAG: ATP-binding cassette domain-containing protein [Mesorhizobium sp.]
MGLFVSGLCKSYGPVQVLADASFEVRPGEVVALLGENGAGKSTVSNIIAGSTKPDAGSITWRGKPYSPASPAAAIDAGVGMIHQELKLLPDLSVAENVYVGRLPMRGGRIDRAAMNARASAQLKRLGLDVSPDRKVRTLRIAAQQQVEIAKALTLNAELLIFDEPTAALGSEETELLFQQIRKLKAEGMSFIYISHRLDEIAEIADRVVVMSQGSIEQVGTADEIYDTPNSPFVYGFIGESSSLPVKVEDGLVWIADRPIGLSAPQAPQGEATLFFRPHDVELVDECNGCIAGTVAASRRVAGTRRVELEIGGERQRVEVELPVDHPAAQKSRVAFRPRRWKLFPAA